MEHEGTELFYRRTTAMSSPMYRIHLTKVKKLIMWIGDLGKFIVLRHVRINMEELRNDAKHG